MRACVMNTEKASIAFLLSLKKISSNCDFRVCPIFEVATKTDIDIALAENAALVLEELGFVKKLGPGVALTKQGIAYGGDW
jgi:hypothetical protein